MKPVPNSQSPVAIIAGNGRLPIEIAQHLQSISVPVFIIALNNEADSQVEHFPHEWWDWERVGRLFKLLKEHAVERIVLAGGVVGRPEFQFRRMDWEAVKTLPGVLSMMLSGDNALLSGVITIFEKRGYHVCSVTDLMPQIAVEIGANTTIKPKKPDIERITEGMSVTSALGEFDIGQGCVVLGKRAVAIEGAEGTDDMLKRISRLRKEGRLPQKRGGVLVKAMKSEQDKRADLPAIGPDTIQAVYDAGLLGIGVQAGTTLMISKEQTIQLAEKLKIFIYGVAPVESSS